MSHVRTIIGKEWTDMLRNKLVLYILVFVPLIMTAIPVAMIIIMRSVPVSQNDLDELGRMLNNPIFANLAPAEAMQSVMASNMLTLFLMMPLMVPVTISAYSIVGEKVARSLEPLLATPITTSRLLIGKSLAAAIPGIGMTWLCYLIFLIFAYFFSVSEKVFDIFVDPMWIVAMFLLVPLLAVMAVAVGVIVSSRVSDPRAAEQLGALVILPLMVLYIGAMAGFIRLNSATFLITSAITALLDVGLVYFGVVLFQRETILTRWK